MHFTFRHEEDEVDPYHNQHQHHRNDNGNQQHYYQRQGRQLHPHHMVRQPRSRSAASLPIAGIDVQGGNSTHVLDFGGLFGHIFGPLAFPLGWQYLHLL